MSGAGDKTAVAAAGRGHWLGKLKCFLERHNYVQDQWDRPRAGPPPERKHASAAANGATQTP